MENYNEENDPYVRKRETIVCAAIWYKNQVPEYFVKSLRPVNLKEGIVIPGIRHGHCIWLWKTMTGKNTNTKESGETIQGFITNKNRFLDRKEARELFIQNGGTPEFNELYSEDLY